MIEYPILVFIGMVCTSKMVDLKEYIVYRMRYEKQLARKKTKTKCKCTICLENISIDQWCRETMCSHKFHVCCIDKWLKNNNTCPNCRTKVSIQN